MIIDYYDYIDDYYDKEYYCKHCKIYFNVIQKKKSYNSKCNWCGKKIVFISKKLLKNEE